MKTNGDILREHADRMGLPPVSLEKAQAGLARAKKNKCDDALARLMLKAGRLSAEARAWIEQEYP